MNKELVDYIKQQMNINVPKKKITSILLGQGWHQSEIDEAFLDAGGSVAPSTESPSLGARQFDDAGQGNGYRKMVLFAALGLAVLAIVVGVIIFPSLGKNNNNSKDASPALPADQGANPPKAEVVDNVPPENGQKPVAEQNNPQVDPAVLAAIEKLAGSITPPSGWVKRLGTISSRPLAAFFKPAAEKDGSGKEVFNENISITRDSLKAVGTADAAAYIAKSKTALQAKIKDYKILSERQVSLSGGTAATLIGGSFTQSGLALKNMQLFVFDGDDVYVVTGVALAANWDGERDMIGAAVMSFKIPSGN